MNNFLNRILIATDGSEYAALAARVAVDLSNRTGAELHVVHAWRNLQPASLPAVASEEYWRARERHEREAGELLEVQAEQLKSTGATVAGTHLREGRPADEIAALAEELEVDLVILGSRGLGTVKRLVTGSVSEGVVHLAPCPTLVVRGGEGAWPPKNVVIGDDSSTEAVKAGELAAGVGKLFGARALLVGVHHSMTIFEARRASHLRMSMELMRKEEELLEERAAELENALGTRPKTRVVKGDAAAIIQEAAEEGEKPALVAVGSRGLGAVRRFTLGSVSTDILRAIGGPVLIVPPPKDESR